VSLLPFVVAAWLILIGLHGVVTSRNLIHLVICVSVVQSGTYVLLLGIGYRTGGIAPIFADQPLGTPAVDPLVQALALVDVVVEATVIALMLALAVQADKRFGTIDPEELRPLKG
jgi:multicomponent Na+:H+ antiporter subunit C